MKYINPQTLSPPRGYSNGCLSEPGKFLFIAGQVGWNEQSRMAQGLTAQFEQALCNILEVVRAAGGKPEHIGRFTIFVKDKQDYLAKLKEIGVAYRKHMGKHYPAMSLLVVKDLLEESAVVEIEATAVVP